MKTFIIGQAQFESAKSVIDTWESTPPRYSVFPASYCSAFTQAVVESTGNSFVSGPPSDVFDFAEVWRLDEL